MSALLHKLLHQHLPPVLPHSSHVREHMSSGTPLQHSVRSPEKAAKEQDFTQAARFEEPDGPVAIITRKETDDGTRYTFKLQKEYVARGQTDRSQTNFFNPKHLDAVRRLLDKVEAEFVKLGVR